MLKSKIGYFKHVGQMAVNNPLRFLLSALGFFLAILIFSVGNIVINSYYNSKFESVNEIDTASIMVKTSYDNDELNERLREIENGIYVNDIGEKETLFVGERIDNNDSVRMVLTGSVLGVSKNVNGVLPIKYSDNEYIQSKTKLVKGRYIDVQDVSQESRVVVIDELTEKIVFGNEDSIGKEIKLNANYSGSVSVGGDNEKNESIVSLTVVGVVENTYYARCKEKMYEKYMNGAKEDVFIETVVYCPISLEYIQKEEFKNCYYVWNYESESKYNDALSRLKSIKLYYEQRRVEMDIFEREAIKSEIEEEMNTLKFLMYFIIIALVIIAGVSTMNIMFFSIKERINEIGIKKALGATKIDIVVQFILEGQIIGLFASCFSVLISIAIVRLLEFYINNEMYIYFQMQIGINEVLLPVSLAIIYSFVFSLLPSIYGANINVTKALRFE